MAEKRGQNAASFKLLFTPMMHLKVGSDARVLEQERVLTEQGYEWVPARLPLLKPMTYCLVRSTGPDGLAVLWCSPDFPQHERPQATAQV